MDANWRWIHFQHCRSHGHCHVGHNCFLNGRWNRHICPHPKTCARKCALEGITRKQYEEVYGVKNVPGGLELGFVSGHNVGSRLYVMDGAHTYKMFKLKNREFSFEVDLSALPCGLNGAVYFTQMKRNGGHGGRNKAGAKYGTGYCDAQCAHDIKFIKGEANILHWNHKKQYGHKGSCCAEMDVWEANSHSAAFTAHPCRVKSQYRCAGKKCGGLPTSSKHRYDGVCDLEGCDFNSYRLGDHNFFGRGSKFAIDTTKPMRVVTQWITEGGTDHGDLVEIRRFYVQHGRVIKNSHARILPGKDGWHTSMTDDFCQAQKKAFDDHDDFKRKGGLKSMGEALDRGMVLVVSLWDDSFTRMRWLDSVQGKGGKSKPGVRRGACPPKSGSPASLEHKHKHAHVTFKHFRFGAIGATFGNVEVHGKAETAPLAAAAAAAKAAADPHPGLAARVACGASALLTAAAVAAAVVGRLRRRPASGDLAAAVTASPAAPAASAAPGEQRQLLLTKGSEVADATAA